jgi:hypothetical protein
VAPVSTPNSDATLADSSPVTPVSSSATNDSTSASASQSSSAELGGIVGGNCNPTCK